MKKLLLLGLIAILMTACANNTSEGNLAKLEQMERAVAQNHGELEQLSLSVRKLSDEQAKQNRRLDEDISLLREAILDPGSRDNEQLIAKNQAKSADASAEYQKDLQELRSQLQKQNTEITALKQAIAAQGTTEVKAPSQPQSPPPAASAPAPASQSAEEKAYEAARTEYNNGNYQKAIQLFDGFTKSYPASSYLGNAHYWKGESRYAMSDWSGALKDFQSVVSQYPNSWKEADSQLKIGMCYMKMGEDAKARAALNLIKRNYPQYGRMDLVNHYLNELD